MLKIRLKRVGRKGDPSFRVVLMDSQRAPKSGKINEVLGFYDPRKDIKELKKEAIQGWIAKGAQVSDTVHNILVDQKVIEGKKINVLPRKSPIVKEVNEVKEEVSTPESLKADDTTEGTVTDATPEKSPAQNETSAPKVAEEKKEAEPEATPEETGDKEE